MLAATQAPAPSDRPSIAVLAFTNMSGDPEQEYFSDGIADDIITELSRMRGLFVIARNTSFTYKGDAIDVKQVGRELGVRYVLEGSVRRGGQRVRVIAQLIDAETGSHVWAERYDCDLADVFVVQDEITFAVTRAIGPAVADAEQRRVLRKPPESLGAWEAYQRGLWHLSQMRVEDATLARSYFNRALELDPTLAAAHTGLSRLYLTELGLFAKRPLEESVQLAGEEARKAVEIDPTDAEALADQAFAVGMAGDFNRGFEYIERALSINPNCVRAYRVKGWLLLNSGNPKEGREAFLFAIRIDPRSALDVTVRSHIAELVLQGARLRECRRRREASRRGSSGSPLGLSMAGRCTGPVGPERRSSGCIGQGGRDRSGRVPPVCGPAFAVDAAGRLRRHAGRVT